MANKRGTRKKAEDTPVKPDGRGVSDSDAIVARLNERIAALEDELRFTRTDLQTRQEELEVQAEELEAHLEDLNSANEALEKEVQVRQLSEEALRKSQFILAKSQEMAHVGNWAWNVRAGEMKWSDESFRIFGYQPDQVRTGWEWLASRVHSDDRGLLSDLAVAVHSGNRKDIDVRVYMPRGSVRHVNILADKIVRDRAGQVSRAYGIFQDITERKQVANALQEKMEEVEAQAEELETQNEEIQSNYEELHEVTRSLHESEALLRAVTDTSPDGIFVKDRECRIVMANPATLLVIGKPMEEVIGRCDREFYDDPVIGEAIMANDRRIMASGQTEVVEEVIPAPGGYRTFLSTKTPFRNAQGEITGILGISRDVTERKRAEEALRESEARRKVAEAVAAERRRLFDILETLPAYLILLTPDYHVPFANRFFRERFGESHGRRCYEYLFGRSEPCDNCETYKVLKTGTPHHWEWTGPDGRNYDIYDYPFRDADGSPLIMEMGIDITERKRAEEALRESEERLVFSLKSADIGAWDLSLVDHTAWRSLRHDQIFGYKVQLPEWTYEMFLDHVLPEDRGHVDRSFQKATTGHGDWDFECRIRRADGAVRWMWAHGRARYDERGQPVRMFGINVDITERKLIEEELRQSRDELEQRVRKRTLELQRSHDDLVTQIEERKQAEEALRESETRFRSYFEMPLLGILITSVEKGVLNVNDKMCSLIGYSAEELKGTTWDKITHPEDLARDVEQFSRVLAGEIDNYTMEKRFIHKNGTIIPTILSVGCVRNPDRSVKYLVAVVQDITARKRAEEGLKEAKAQAELYLDLMGHDISNMHQIALSQLELVQEIMKDEGRIGVEGLEMIDTPIETLRRSARLIDNVRKLQKLRAGEYRIETVDLGKVLAEVVREHAAPGNGVTINYAPAGECLMKANPLIKEAFTNLVGNAIKHARGSATIDIGVGRISEGGAVYHRITITDNGPGIPDEKKGEIFHRFKRGQTHARGTGLGLYIVKTLVENFRGRVMVEDRVTGDHTQGSKFIVDLPVAEDHHE